VHHPVDFCQTATVAARLCLQLSAAEAIRITAFQVLDQA